MLPLSSARWASSAWVAALSAICEAVRASSSMAAVISTTEAACSEEPEASSEAIWLTAFAADGDLDRAPLDLLGQHVEGVGGAAEGLGEPAGQRARPARRSSPGRPRAGGPARRPATSSTRRRAALGALHARRVRSCWPGRRGRVEQHGADRRGAGRR